VSPQYIQLSASQVALATLLILISGALSLYFRLGMTKPLWIASVRTLVQLFLMGFLLQWIFQAQSLWLVILMMTAMTLVAAWTATQRSARPYPGILVNSTTAIWTSSWVLLLYGTFILFRVPTWSDPQYVIPLLGMILGNSLNGICLALDRFTEELVSKRDQVELALSFGANSWEAARPALVTAVRTGTLPIINSMMVAGIVSLPGMMTGQLIAGVSPLEAVKYQIVIMFLISTSTLLGTLLASFFGYRRLFNEWHQFEYWKVGQKK
jgi:putative ABC transport system permease protein